MDKVKCGSIELLIYHDNTANGFNYVTQIIFLLLTLFCGITRRRWRQPINYKENYEFNIFGEYLHIKF